MATGVITNKLQDPSGTPLAGVTVNARLMPSPTGFRSTTFFEITQLATTVTNASGDWQLVLEINTDIEPGDSYWQIEELIPETAGDMRVWSIQVGSGTNSLYASLVSTPPTVSVPSYITQSSGDARYAPFSGLTLGSVQAVGTATATGTATTAASSNHVHPLSPAVIGNGLALSAGVVNAVGSGFVTVSATTMIVKSGYRVSAVGASVPSDPAPSEGDVWVDTSGQLDRIRVFTTATFVVSTGTWVYASGGPRPAYAARTYHNGAVNIAGTGTVSLIPLGTVDYDYSNATNSNAYLVTVAGLYKVHGLYSFQLSDTTAQRVYIAVFNGPNELVRGDDYTLRGGTSNDVYTVQVSDEIYLTSTCSLSLRCFGATNGGGAISGSGGTIITGPSLTVRKL